MKAQVYLSTLGCRLNEAELSSWSHAFEARGHTLVSRAEDANLIVLNTCAVTAEASRKSRKLAGTLHRKSPNAKLVLTGCMAELEPERARELHGVDLVIGNRDKEELVAQVLGQLDLETMPSMATEPESVHPYAPGVEQAPARASGLVRLEKAGADRTRAFIKVQDGCRNHCSYCVVTIARGDERSRSIADVVAEIGTLQAKGYREAVLTGVHLGGYGHDLGTDRGGTDRGGTDRGGTDLMALVQAILAETSIERLRLSSLEPWDLPANFGELWQNPRLMPHLHLPLQSGCDSVLRRMSRRCFTEEYRDLARTLRAAIPGLNITTDLIVGFPGESDAEFEASLRFVEEIGFGHVHIFGFSAREGTRAASLPGRVPGPVIRERSRLMHRLAARMKEASMHSYLGSVRSVLWEGSGVDSDAGRLYQGYTDNYLRVETTVDSKASLRQHIADALLVELIDAPADRFRAQLVP